MKNPGNKILLIGASPRKNGNSDLLMETASEGIASENVPSETVYLRDFQYSPCIGCEQCRRDRMCTRLHDGMTLLYPKIESSGGALLASPVHHYNITSWMKAFIDRLYCYYDFEDTRPRAWSSRLAAQGRKGAVIGVCEQADAGDMGFVIEAMQLPMEALGYDIVAVQRVFRVFARREVSRHQQALDEAYAIGRRLAVAVREQYAA